MGGNITRPEAIVRNSFESSRNWDKAVRSLRATSGLMQCSKTIHHLITALVRAGIQRIAVGATVEPVAPCSLSGCMMNANS